MKSYGFIKSSEQRGKIISPQKWHLVWVLIFSFFVAQGCSVTLISEYDEKTDQAVTELQRKFETLFINLESQIGSDAAKYEKHNSFYKEAKVDISAIKLRANAIEKNKITLKQIELLEDNLEILENIHKDGITEIELVNLVREDFNTALSNILQLELAKKEEIRRITNGY